MKKKIVILQNTIMDYRKPVYDGLSGFYDVTVVHSGKPVDGETHGYRETIVSCRMAGPFFLQNPLRVRQAVANADAVIAMFDLRWPAYLVPMARGPGRYILWGQGYSRNRGVNVVRDWLIKKADRLLLYGAEGIEGMVARGIDRERIVVAPNTIHVPNHQDHSGHPKHSLLFVGRLQPRKRIDDLIETFARLEGRLPDDTVLDIVGGGALMPALKALADARGVSAKVRFHGAVTDHAELSRLFASAYAYVSPGPVGLGALHSFSYGVPVITLRAERHGPEFHNLAHEKNALICDDMAGLESAIERICNQPGFALKLGASAYGRYSERTLDRVLAGFRTAIED